MAEWPIMERTRTHNVANLVADWRELLLTETDELDRAGVHAAIVAIRIEGDNVAAATRSTQRAASLLARRIRPTDRLGTPDSSSLAVLLSPSIELTQTIEQVRGLSLAMSNHQIQAVTAFAHRRPNEVLLETWARAEAEVDRAIFRRLHGAGISI